MLKTQLDVNTRAHVPGSRNMALMHLSMLSPRGGGDPGHMWGI